MAVIGHKLKFSGPTGSLTSKGASYTATYLVETNDPLDGPVAVWLYVIANIVTIGESYAHGNDADLLSFCNEITIPQHEPGSANWWSVTAKYEPAPSEDEQDKNRNDDGDPVANPKDRAAEISIRYSLSSEPVEKAIYRGGFTHGKYNDGDEIVPQNSALDPFDPPLEKDAPIQVIRITKTVDTWDGDTADLYFNQVNSSALKWKAWVDATQTFPVRTLKVNAIDATHKWDSVAGDWDWEVTVELHYKPSGWRVDVVDRGHQTILEAGDDDGRGGIVSPSDLPKGVMSKKVPVDHDGLSALGPVLLDGNGKLLDLGDPNVYITYQIYTEANILLCPVLDKALEAAP